MYRVKPVITSIGNARFRLQKRRFFIWWNLNWYFTRAEAERVAIHLESGTTRVYTHGWDCCRKPTSRETVRESLDRETADHPMTCTCNRCLLG